MMQTSTCIKCNSRIHSKSNFRDIGIQCSECGAHYELKEEDSLEGHIDYTFEYTGFRCIHKKSFSDPCQNTCPGPAMFCKEHITDKYFDKISEEISYAEQRLEEVKEELSKMNESKRIWLISEMSGIDEQ